MGVRYNYKYFTTFDDTKVRLLDLEAPQGAGDGDKEAVLLIHGWMGSTAMWEEGALPFQHNIVGKLQQRGFRVIATDCRGHGESDKPQEVSAYGIKLVQDHVDVLDLFKIDQVHLVGASMGADIGLKMACAFPDRVISLCLIGSGWSYGTEWCQNKYNEYQPEEIPKTFMERLLPCCSSRREEENKHPPLGEVADMEACLQAGRSMQEVLKITEEDLKSLDGPVHCIVGERDKEKEYVDRMEGVVKHFSKEILPGKDHYGTFTDRRYAEEVVAVVTKCEDEWEQSKIMTPPKGD